MGSESYTVAESSNSLNQTSGQTITGTGAYTLTDVGPGATFPASTSGYYSYTLVANDDNASGELSESETGSDRYGLLQAFNNVANAGASSTPGNMNYSPYGQPFVDPSWWDSACNFVGGVYRETVMIGSYVLNNPGEAASAAKDGVQQGVSNINQAVTLAADRAWQAAVPVILGSDMVLGNPRTGWFAQTGNAATGMADVITAGGVSRLQQAMGTADMVDRNSAAFATAPMRGRLGTWPPCRRPAAERPGGRMPRTINTVSTISRHPGDGGRHERRPTAAC